MHLHPGDRIVAINGHDVDNIESSILAFAIAHESSDQLSITVLRENKKITLSRKTNWDLIQNDTSLFQAFGITISGSYRSATISGVRDFSSAERSGIKSI